MLCPSTPAAPLLRATRSHACSRVVGRITLSIRLNHLPPLTPLPSADTMASVQTDASTQPQSRFRASVPCLAEAGTVETVPCVISGPPPFHFLPPFPRAGFARAVSVKPESMLRSVSRCDSPYMEVDHGSGLFV